MSDLSAYIAQFRADGHTAPLYCSFLIGSQVCSATVDTTPADGALNLTITVVTGAMSNAKEGMEVVVETAGGLFKGRTHIRAGGTLSPTNLPIREWSNGDIAIVATDVVKVRREWRIHGKLPAADETFAPDHITYVDQGSNPGPLVCSGGHYAGFVDDGAAFATVLTTGSNTTLVDPDSTTPPTHLWTLVSGVAFKSGSANTDANPTLEVNAGEYWITHRGADGDNSTTNTQYIGLRAHSAADMPYEIEDDGLSISGTPADGWTFTGRIDPGTLTMPAPHLLHGCLCIVWMWETINGTRQSFGKAASGRSHILFTGVVRNATIGFDADDGRNRLDIEALSPLARLKAIAGYSKVMISDNSPDSWIEMRTLSVKRAYIQLWQFYTTAMEAGYDLITHASFSNALYSRFYLDANTAPEQITELVDGRFGRLICDGTGRFEVQPRFELMPLDDRIAIEDLITLGDDDIHDLEFTFESQGIVQTVHLRGFIAGATDADNQPVFAKAPSVPNEGTDTTSAEKKIVDNVAHAYIMIGLIEADIDRVFIDANGEKHIAPTGSITLKGAYLIFDFYLNVLRFASTMAAHLLDIALDDYRWLITAISYDFDGGEATTTLQLKAETNGAAGVDDTPPTEVDNGLPDFTLPDFAFTPTPIVPILAIDPALRAGIRMAAICDNGLALTGNFGAGAGVYWQYWYSWASLGLTGTLLSWVPHGGTSPAAGMLYTSDEIDYLVISTQVLSVLNTYATPANNSSADAAFRNDGSIHFAVARYLGASGGVVVTETDDLVTFTDDTASAFYATGGGIGAIDSGIHVSTRFPGRILTSGFTSTGAWAGLTMTGRRRPNFAGAFADVTLPDSLALARSLHVPYHDNASEAIIYQAVLENTAEGNTSHGFYRNTTNISPVIASRRYMPNRTRNGVDTYVGDRRRMLGVMQHGNVAGGALTDAGWAIFLTDQAHSISSVGSSDWRVLVSGTPYRQCAIDGGNAAKFYFWGDAGAVGFSADSGLTITSQQGNLGDYTPGTIIGIAAY